MRIALTILTLLCLSGCTVFEDMMSFDTESSQTAKASQAEQQSMMEQSIITGRFGVMLGQAREILRLPEPRSPITDETAPPVVDSKAERQRLAQDQAKVVAELLSDTARACQRKRLARDVRKIACDHQNKVPASLKQTGQSDLSSIAARNEEVGAFVIEWWDAVCATAPRPRAGEPHTCSIE